MFAEDCTLMEVKVKIDDALVRANLGKLSGKMKTAMERGLKDTIVEIANDAIKGSPVLTGNNRRSIRYEAKGLTASTFSSSGYGGYLETGTSKMGAQPYFRPALDRNLPKLGKNIKGHL